jgi:hypothetical protein
VALQISSYRFFQVGIEHSRLSWQSASSVGDLSNGIFRFKIYATNKFLRVLKCPTHVSLIIRRLRKTKKIIQSVWLILPGGHRRPILVRRRWHKLCYRSWGGCAKRNPIGPINAPVSRGPQRSLVPGRSPGMPKVPGTRSMTQGLST